MLALLGALGAASLVRFFAAPIPVHATCAADPDNDVSDLFSISPPAPDLTIHGEAPLQVTITFIDKSVLSGPLTMSISWGDGASTPVALVSCGDDVYSWPAQQLSHTFTNPGQYAVQWHLGSQFIGNIDSLAVIVTVTGAATQPPATATPVPTAAPQATTAAPTLAPTQQAAAPGSPTPTPVAEASPAPSPTPTATSTNTRTPTPAPTSPATPTPTIAPAVAASAPPPPSPDVPQLVIEVPDIADISTDPGVATTNLVLAGITVWVFFSSVLFNQTLQENREEVEGWARKLRPKLPATRLSSASRRWGGPLGIGAVLLGTGFVYGFLEPSFGLNRASLLLFASVVIGVGLVGMFFAGLETWIRRKEEGVSAAVSPFPLALAIGAACVIASRALDLHPGVMYGIAASCVVAGQGPSSRMEGRVQALTVSACVALSVLCWLLLSPARSLPHGWPADLLQGVAVIVFVGGMEGLLIDLIPLQAMDGAKIYRWNRFAWAALVLVSAFLVWHVLLNTHRSSFDSLRPATSWSVLLGFLVYTAAGAAFWGYFAFRRRHPAKLPESGAS
jgi:hypothetical protein